MKSPLLLLLALAFTAPVLAADPRPADKGDAAKGETIASQVCVACHTFDGTRGLSANPILQGQHPEYLLKQLQDFKSGARDSAIMKGFAATLGEQDMRDVAAFYASKTAKPGAATDKATLLLGERIYRGGVADRRIAACAGCHSPNGAGIPSQYPRLSGQHGEYSEAQLNAFRSGQRANSVPMAGVAARLNDREIKALADYMAGLH
ncbi:MAG TPA: c-type cytochrome [Rubrivivax sp.]|nr:c-type cytochrome [Rubrivivax sp.]